MLHRPGGGDQTKGPLIILHNLEKADPTPLARPTFSLCGMPCSLVICILYVVVWALERRHHQGVGLVLGSYSG